MQVVACQLDLVWENKTVNQGRVLSLLRRVPVQPDSLIVLPEMFATGFSMDVARIGEPADGPTTRFLASVAIQLRSHVVAGVAVRGDDGRGRNEAVVVGPDGTVAARYCKLHPFSYAGETAHYAPGGDVVTFRCGPFTVAPLVCYDLRFPEAFRRAVRRGADVLVVIANWPGARAAHWQTLLRARAIENQSYVIGVNRTGADPNLQYSGGSVILDPRGEVLAAAAVAETALVAELTLEPLVAYRREFPALNDIRADLLPD